MFKHFLSFLRPKVERLYKPLGAADGKAPLKTARWWGESTMESTGREAFESTTN